MTNASPQKNPPEMTPTATAANDNPHHDADPVETARTGSTHSPPVPRESAPVGCSDPVNALQNPTTHGSTEEHGSATASPPAPQMMSVPTNTQATEELLARLVDRDPTLLDWMNERRKAQTPTRPPEQTALPLNTRPEQQPTEDDGTLRPQEVEKKGDASPSPCTVSTPTKKTGPPTHAGSTPQPMISSKSQSDQQPTKANNTTTHQNTKESNNVKTPRTPNTTALKTSTSPTDTDLMTSKVSDRLKGPSKTTPDASTKSPTVLQQPQQPSIPSAKQAEKTGEVPSNTPPALRSLSNDDTTDSITEIAPNPETPQTSIKTQLPSGEYYTTAALIHLERQKFQVDIGTVFSHFVRKSGLSDPESSTDEEQTVMARAISLAALYKCPHDTSEEYRNGILNIVLDVSDAILTEWSMGQPILDEKHRRADNTSDKNDPPGPQPPELTKAITTICEIITECKYNEEEINGKAKQLQEDSDRQAMELLGNLEDYEVFAQARSAPTRSKEKTVGKRKLKSSPKATPNKKKKSKVERPKNTKETPKTKNSVDSPKDPEDEPLITLKSPPENHIQHFNKSKAFGKPITIVSTGMKGGSFELGETVLPRSVIGRDTDTSKLVLKAVLINWNDHKDPLILRFVASWGNKLHLRDSIAPHYSVDSLLFHITQAHPMTKFLPEDTAADLIDSITLVMDGTVMMGNRQVGEYMSPTVTGKDLYPNKITINVDGFLPPTMTVKERNALVHTCKQAKFQIQGKNMLEFPGVHKYVPKGGRPYLGIPIVAKNGGKNQPRYALLQPPIEEVSVMHNGERYVHTNLVVLWAGTCQRNRVKVMIRYYESPKTVYMVYPEDFRVYQEPKTRISDVPVLGGKKWKGGYVINGFNATVQDEPAPCCGWTEIAESASLATIGFGDLQLYTGTDQCLLVPCELDTLRAGPDIDTVVEMDKTEAVKTWGNVRADLAHLLEELKKVGISGTRVTVLLYIHTCSAGQLGEIVTFLRTTDQWSDTLRGRLTPSHFFKMLYDVLLGKKDSKKTGFVHQFLSRIDSYITSEASLKGQHASPRLIHLRLMNSDTEPFEQYTSVSYFLQHIEPSTIKNYKESKSMLALRLLKIDDCIKKEEPDVTRPQERKGFKPSARRSSPELINYWKRCGQGKYAVKHRLALPEENVHTSRAVPQVIKDLEGVHTPSLGELAKWVHEYYETHDLNIRQIIDGDLLQVFNAIFISGLLQQLGHGPEVVKIQDSDSDASIDSDDDDVNSSTRDNDSSDNSDDNHERDSENGDSSDS